MKFQIIASGRQRESRYQYLVSYVVNDRVAIDGGCLGFGLSLTSQKQITHLFLSHCHLDHVASLPIFLDNVYEYGPHCVTIHGSGPTVAVLQEDILNDRIWPDFVSLSTPASPFLKLNPVGDYQTVCVEELRVTPLPLRHVVPTYGFLIEDDQAAIAVISDTWHSSEAWSRLAAVPNLRAVFLECSFPNELSWLAEKSQHLTPATFLQESEHLPESVRFIAIHIKPTWYDAIVRELKALKRPNIEVSQVGVEYHF